VPAHSPLIEFVVCAPGIHRKEYGAVPPVGFAVADPLHDPEHVAFTEVTLFCTAVGSVIVIITCAVHANASVTVTVYVPSHRAEIEGVVCPPGAHEYVYPGLPPETVTDAVPSHTPLQLAFVDEGVTISCGGCVRFIIAVSLHPLKSVT
jgi:hypothetical protein